MLPDLKQRARFLSGSVEWYTPVDIVESVRDVLGTIDLDPCSTAEANATVGAAEFLTQAQDGLRHEWRGRIFMNPPYGRGVGHWVGKLTDSIYTGDVTEAVLLTNVSSSSAWFVGVWSACSLCFPRERIRFSAPGGGFGPRPTHDSVIAYWGARVQQFEHRFRHHGRIMRPPG